MAVALDGHVLASAESKLPASATTVSGPRVEQDPLCWTTATQEALRSLSAQLPANAAIVGVAVDATSGTFLLTDAQGLPLTPGIMYNDQRAVDVTPAVAAPIDGVLARYGIRIASSFALPKIVHLLRTSPELRQRCRHVVHQTDWVVALLTDKWDVTDVSTALKTGADPGTLRWPECIDSLGLPLEWLPRVVLPGTPLGEVTAEGESRTGLPRGTPVIAGCTDGTAGCLASGARLPGELNVTLGTTLVFKGIAREPIVDPAGAIYNHRHPAGGYLPGAASSTGAEWVAAHFGNANLEQLTQQAEQYIPTSEIVYPLVKQGERFPFACAEACGFGLDQIPNPAERFAAGLQAVAFLERMAIERFETLGLPIGPTVFATGGGTASELWLKIRASVTRRCYSVPQQTACAIGAAVLAATPALGGCEAAIEALIRRERTVEPHMPWTAMLDEAYLQFLGALRERGFWRGDA